MPTKNKIAISKCLHDSYAAKQIKPINLFNKAI